MNKLFAIIHTTLILLKPVNDVQRQQIVDNNKYGLWLGYNMAFTLKLNNNNQVLQQDNVITSVQYKYTLNNDSNLYLTNTLTSAQLNNVNYNSSDTLMSLPYLNSVSSVNLFIDFRIASAQRLSILNNPSNVAEILISYSARDINGNEYEPENNSITHTLSASNGDFAVTNYGAGTTQSIFIYNIDLSDLWLNRYTDNGVVEDQIKNMKRLIAYVEELRLPMYVSTGQIGNYTNIEVVDFTGLIFMILSMPFTFFKQAFDFTFFEGTPYAFNISYIFLFIISVLAFIAVIKLILPLIRGK